MAPKSGSAELLAALRAAMATQGLTALVVPSEGMCVLMCVWTRVDSRGLCGCGRGLGGEWGQANLIASNPRIHVNPHTTIDAHQSEYTPERDRRREYVSGFTGSAGTGEKSGVCDDARR